MTVRKGEAWGEAGGLPDGGVVVASDAEARRVVTTARRAGEPVPALGLVGGDLCRTLGGPGNLSRTLGGPGNLSRAPAGRHEQGRTPSVESTRLSVDLASVLVDGVQHWFVAHLVSRGSWWRGRIVAAMNAEFLGDWDVAPRAHPGDGLLDVLDVSAAMPLGDRLRARRRLPTGGHVPHPAIAVQRRPAVQVDLDRPTPVWLDGELVGRARHLSLRVEPDALVCVV